MGFARKDEERDDELGRAGPTNQCVPSQMLLQDRLDLRFGHDANNPIDLDSILDDQYRGYALNTIPHCG